MLYRYCVRLGRPQKKFYTTTTQEYKGIFVQKFGGKEVLKVGKSVIPKAPSGQVLVKIRAAGVNPVDSYIRSGSYANLPPLPWVPGKDGAGEVAEVGESVQGLKQNDRVWLSSANTGTYAQYSLVPGGDLHPLPDSHSFYEGASLWTNYATAYHAVHHIGKVKPGETVLIHGASGGVGLASIYWLSQIPGVTIIGTGGTRIGIELVKKLGVHHAYDHTDTHYLKFVSNASDSKIDVILEMLANVNLNNDLELLNKGGRVCVIGNRGTVDKFNPRSLMAKRSSISGVMLTLITPEEKKEIIDAISRGLHNNTLKPEIGMIYPISKAPDAHDDVMLSHIGKIIIDPWK